MPDGFDAGDAAARVAAEPDVWTDGSLVEDEVSGASSSGSGFFSFRSGHLWATAGGVILMMKLEVTGLLGLAVVYALFLVLYRLFKGLSFGELSLLFRLLMVT